MTCVRDIMDEEQLDREIRSIRNTFRDLSQDEKPLRIEWGTKEAMEEAERGIERRALEVAKKVDKEKEELSTKSIARGLKYLITDYPLDYEFHDDEITNERIIVRRFPYMHIFGDFRIFNGLPLRVVDTYLADLVPVFVQLWELHKVKAKEEG